MLLIRELTKAYSNTIDFLDLELIIANTLGKSREFILAHPEFKIGPSEVRKLKIKISRRERGEPLAYILGHKEFFGLDFKVNKNTLIPRPETELLVEKTVNHISTLSTPATIIDVGTGSGNIITALAKKLTQCHPELVSVSKRCRNKFGMTNTFYFFATDISKKALQVAKYNARKNKVDKKIKFFQGDLLEPVLDNRKLKIENSGMIILANLPYLSKKIYSETSPDIKNFEPESALLSKNGGLAHYGKLLQQIKKNATCYVLRVMCFIEFSPEQKKPLEKLIKEYFPRSRTIFHKDLTQKWRLAEIHIGA